MRSMRSVALVVFVSLGVGSTASADVQLSIRDGQVSIVARNATVGQILAEWARVGQTKIVNLERIPREPVTLELINVSEQSALDVLLRTASGYVAAQRVSAVPNASRFDHIIVMPPSVVVAQATSAPAASRYAKAAPAPAYDAPADVPPAVEAAAPEAVPDATGDEAADSGSMPFDVAGAVPPPTPRMQEMTKQRRALETVDPRTFQIPKQPQGGFVAPPVAGPPMRGVAQPGQIVQPPAPRRPPGTGK